MDDAAQRVIAEAEEAQRRFKDVLTEHGLTEESLARFAASLRARLPRAELERVERAKGALLNARRQRPGTSALRCPMGIRA